MRTQNNPKPGDVISVEPIRDLEAIKKIKEKLSDNPRDYALFVVGVNTGLRAGDILKLTVGKVREILADGANGGLVRETKTSKTKRILFNNAARDALRKLLATKDYDSAEYIFQSQRSSKAKQHRMTESYLCRLVKKWCKMVNLRGHHGSHTLRKSWAYHQRVTFNVDIPTIMKTLGHSTQRQTLEYLCIQDEEIRTVYNNQL